MGRLTELLDFINRESIPSPQTREFIYFHISVDDELLNLRRVYRSSINRNTKQSKLNHNKHKPDDDKSL